MPITTRPTPKDNFLNPNKMFNFKNQFTNEGQLQELTLVKKSLQIYLSATYN